MQLSLEYLAGLFDGEGSFCIQVQLREHKGRPNVLFNPRMSMSLKYGNTVLGGIVRQLGGTIYHYSDGMARWHLGRREELIKAANALVPHLVIKRVIGERFLHALSLFPDTKKSGQHFDGERSWDLERTVEVAEIAFSLNPQSSRKAFRELKAIYEVEEVAV